MKVRVLRLLSLLALCFVTNLSVHAQTAKISAGEAKSHVGEKTTVCGNVVSIRYADKSKGQPTFLNLDEPYPKQIFTILIWGSDRSKFGDPENKYRDKRVCVTGTITNYRGIPEITASDPTKIEIEK
jgi:DNA/RNA endonuclease YhcR with UshA esterase domain